MTYAKGLHRPDPAKSAHRSRLLGVDGPQTPRGSAMLTPCPVLDQGPTGTCHAHSAAGAIWTAYQATGQPPAFVPSPGQIAALTYATVQGPASVRGPLQDTGADLSDDAKALAKWGVAPMRAPTADGRNSDAALNADGSFPEPDVGQMVISGAALIAGEYSIVVDADAPRLCALSLDQGIPIWLGTLVGSAFERLQSDQTAEPTDPTEYGAGGHALYAYGYRTASDGTYEFRVMNSWGTGWCDGGGCWVSQAWLLACWMLWPMAVVK